MMHFHQKISPKGHQSPKQKLTNRIQNCITPYLECTTPINTPIDLKKLEQETQTIESQDITNLPATKSSPML
jgi:hypothetical protein